LKLQGVKTYLILFTFFIIPNEGLIKTLWTDRLQSSSKNFI
jgi:hypothetical protein